MAEPTPNAEPGPSSGRHIALIGMAGAGKSAVARRLGASSGRRVVDIDAAIIERSGSSIPELFAAIGESGFRSLETAELEGCLASDEPLVIATGGGVVERLCSEFSRWGLTRADAVVSVGGGIVTDVAGFAASVYHRGIPVVHVATSLLAQIDAAIGGKTGVNLPEGKNLVGAYWQPSAVLCDTDLLDTLPPEEYRCGLGELAKYHWLGGGSLDELPLDERVARCVQIKADVVASDEREGGRRAILNYGHTLAHAIEIADEHRLRHGEAVAIGLIYAAEVAHRLGRIDAAAVAEHRRVIGRYDLPGMIPAGLDDEELLALFARDKKATREVTFVLDGPDGVEPVRGIDEVVLRDALAALR